MRKFIAIILSVSVIMCFAGCSRNSVKEDGRLKISVSVFPAYDFVRAVTGGSADITMLIDPGSSVHSYDPSPADIAAVASSDLFIYTGGVGDSWADKISAGTGVKAVFKMMDNCPDLSLSEHHHDEDEHEGEDHDEVYDEHVWTSPDNCVSIITAIAETLSGIDPENAERYRKNAAEYAGEIAGIDAELKDFIKTAPRHKIIVADKFPFHYLTKHYGLDYAAVFDSCNDQGDADAAAMAEVIKSTKEESIRYIYYVELTSGNIAKAVCEQTGAEALLLHSMQNVSRDDFEGGVTCAELMRRNAENLRKGLC